MMTDLRKLTMWSRVLFLSLTTSSHPGYLSYNLKFEQEAGDEERKEVSNTLRKLRIKYDTINKLVREKEKELEEKKVSEFKTTDSMVKLILLMLSGMILIA